MIAAASPVDITKRTLTRICSIRDCPKKHRAGACVTCTLCAGAATGPCCCYVTDHAQGLRRSGSLPIPEAAEVMAECRAAFDEYIEPASSLGIKGGKAVSR